MDWLVMCGTNAAARIYDATMNVASDTAGDLGRCGMTCLTSPWCVTSPWELGNSLPVFLGVRLSAWQCLAGSARGIFQSARAR